MYVNCCIGKGSRWYNRGILCIFVRSNTIWMKITGLKKKKYQVPQNLLYQIFSPGEIRTRKKRRWSISSTSGQVVRGDEEGHGDVPGACTGSQDSASAQSHRISATKPVRPPERWLSPHLFDDDPHLVRSGRLHQKERSCFAGFEGNGRRYEDIVPVITRRWYADRGCRNKRRSSCTHAMSLTNRFYLY